VLAAIDRAHRHTGGPRSEKYGAAWQNLVAHLGFAHNSWTTRNLRPQVDALTADGLVTRTWAHSKDWWKLTKLGRSRLARARRAGEVDDLPTSPQRLLWRRDRTIATEEIDRIRAGVGSALDDARRLLDSDDGDSDAWKATGKRLARECDRLRAAVFCLREWPEPDDAHPDLDPCSDLNRKLAGVARALRGDE
jgi:hypothetical protein